MDISDLKMPAPAPSTRAPGPSRADGPAEQFASTLASVGSAERNPAGTDDAINPDGRRGQSRRRDRAEGPGAARRGDDNGNRGAASARRDATTKTASKRPADAGAHAKAADAANDLPDAQTIVAAAVKLAQTRAAEQLRDEDAALLSIDVDAALMQVSTVEPAMPSESEVAQAIAQMAAGTETTGPNGAAIIGFISLEGAALPTDGVPSAEMLDDSSAATAATAPGAVQPATADLLPTQAGAALPSAQALDAVLSALANDSDSTVSPTPASAASVAEVTTAAPISGDLSVASDAAPSDATTTTALPAVDVPSQDAAATQTMSAGMSSDVDAKALEPAPPTLSGASSTTEAPGGVPTTALGADAQADSGPDSDTPSTPTIDLSDQQSDVDIDMAVAQPTRTDTSDTVVDLTGDRISTTAVSRTHASPPVTATRSADVAARVAQIARALENAPPPRSVGITLPELGRVDVRLRDGAVHITIESLATNLESADGLVRALSKALGDRGMNFGSFNGRAQEDERAEENDNRQFDMADAEDDTEERN